MIFFCIYLQTFSYCKNVKILYKCKTFNYFILLIKQYLKDKKTKIMLFTILFSSVLFLLMLLL